MPNLTKLATGEMPKGRGRKGGKAPARRKASLPIENRCEMTVPTYSAAPPASSSFHTVVNTSIAETSVMNAPSLNSSVVNAPAGSVNSVDISSFHFMSPPTYLPPYMPYRPPNAVSVDPVSGGKNAFRVRFIVGNISVCHGCKGRYHKVHLTIYAFSTRSGVPILSQVLLLLSHDLGMCTTMLVQPVYLRCGQHLYCLHCLYHLMSI